MRHLAPFLIPALLLGGGISGVSHAAEDGSVGAIVRPAVGGTVLAVIGDIELGASPTGVMVTADDTVLVSAVTRQVDDTITEGVVVTLPPGTTSGVASSVQVVDLGVAWQPIGIESGTVAGGGDDTAVILGSTCSVVGSICDDSVTLAYWRVPDDTVVATRILTGPQAARELSVAADGNVAVVSTEFASDDSLLVIPSPTADLQFVPLGLAGSTNVNVATAITADDTVWFAAHWGASTTQNNQVGFFSLDDTSNVTVLPTTCTVKDPQMALSSGRAVYLESCPNPNQVPIGLGLRSETSGSLLSTWTLAPDAISDLASGNSHVLASTLNDLGAAYEFGLSVLNPIAETVVGSVVLEDYSLNAAQAPNSGLIYATQFANPNTGVSATSLAVIDNVAVSGLSVAGGSAGTSTSFDVTATSGATWDDTTIESVTFGGVSASFSRTGNTVTASAPAGSGSVAVVVTFNGGNSLNVGTFTYPSPPPVYPPSAPRDVTAVAGDRTATVSWSVPSSSGSFPISNYQVRSTPASDGCVTAELTCEISELVTGAAYTFEVRALNGAGWGPWSVASEPVTPGPAASIVITGTRGTVNGRPGVIVNGTTTGLVGATVTPWFRFPGQSSYTEGTGTRTVDAEGEFTWVRQTGKRIYVYFRSGDTRSNRVIIDR